MFLQRSTNSNAISMWTRSSSCYFLAGISILTVCLEAALCTEPDRQTRTVVELSEKELHRRFPELAGLKSAATQTDLPMILQRVAANEDAFLRNIPDLTAREDVVVQQVHRAIAGVERVFPVFSGKYTYLVLAHRESDGVHLVEYRTDLKGNEIKPGNRAPVSTQGFALVALLFDPFHQTLAAFRYLGRQRVDHAEMYVVAFAQRPDGGQFTGQINIGGKAISTAYQGIAWIDPVKFQICRMRTDLLEPRPDVDLLTQTTEVDFMKVHLPTVGSPLWLPQSVVVTILGNGQLVRNHHKYYDYQRFVANSRIVPVN